MEVAVRRRRRDRWVFGLLGSPLERTGKDVNYRKEGVDAQCLSSWILTPTV
jgi:hypothetical protein